jgi:paraquat-inducible protein B
MADRQAAIGAFVLGGIVLGLGAIILFGNFRLFQPVTAAAVVFEGSISGLSVGAPVTFRGVRVGSVERIVIQYEPSNKTAYIPVTLRLEPDRVRVAGQTREEAGVDLQSLIARGLRAELVTQSFVTGQSQIDLDFDPGSMAKLHPGVTSLMEIPTRQSAIQRVTEQLSQLPLGELVGNTNAALISVRSLAEKLDTDLPPLVASLKATSDGASQTLDGASHTLDVATKAIADLQGRLDKTLGHVDTLAVNSDQQLVQRSADLHALIASTTQTVQQTRDILNELKGVTAARSDVRTNLDATLRDLAAAAASLRGFASDVEQNPQLLLTGRRP